MKLILYHSAWISILFVGCSSSADKLVCGPGTLRSGNLCVARPPNCGQFASIREGQCTVDPLPTPRCGPGTHRMGTECVPGAIATATSAWVANVQVSEASLDFATEAAMSVDSRGNITIAAIIFPHYDPTKFSASIGVWSSRDGGTSFSRVFTANGTPAAYLGDPTVLHDHQDRLYLGWVSYTSTGTADLRVVRSMDGATFSDAEVVDRDRKGRFRDRPWFSIAPDGSVSVSWVDLFGGGAWRAVSRDGSPFGEVEMVTSAADFALINAPIATDPTGISIGIDEDLRAWRRANGVWSPVKAFDREADIDPQPQVVWSANTGFVVVFLGPPRFGISLYALRSVDGGLSWSTPQPIAGAAVGGSSTALPWLTTDEHGRIHVLWLDSRSGAWTPYTSVSEDGLHFSAHERIGDDSFTDNGDERRWLGDFNTIFARGGRRYATWADSRKGMRSEVFFSSAPEGP